MGTQVAAPNATALAAAQALKGKLAKASASVPTQGVSQFLRLLTDGNWVFGADNAEIGPKDEIAINTLEIKTGKVCWTDYPGKQTNEVLGEVMVPLGVDVPLVSDLPKHDYPWVDQISFPMKVVTGKHKGKELTYKSTSVGGKSAMKSVMDQIMLQLDDDPEYSVPVVTLSNDHYNHKKWGKTYTPVLEIVDWISMDGPEMKETAEPEPEKEAEKEVEEQEEAKPVRAARRRAAEPEPEKEVEEAELVDATGEEEQPRRRRRR